MRNVNKWRYIPLKKFSPHENMAIDEYLINYYRKEKIPVIRVYGWDPEAISVGRNQDALSEIDVEECGRDCMGIVRRITGGGAILHGGELTYSVVCSEKEIGAEKARIKESFKKLNNFILNMYKKLGLAAGFADDEGKGEGRRRFSPFCFAGNEDYDVIINGKKIGGNAQRRIKGVIFQHGSVPYEKHEKKIKKYFKNKINFSNYTCLKEQLKEPPCPEELEKYFLAEFRKNNKAVLQKKPLTENEREKASEIVMKRYGRDTWNLKGEEFGSGA